MKNFNDVINSVGEAINNAAQSGNIEEMLNKTKAYAKKSAEAIEISRKRIELLDAKTKLAKAFENDKQLAAAYARQLPKHDCSPEELYARKFNYSVTPLRKTKEDIEQLGIKTYFCSNVAADSM